MKITANIITLNEESNIAAVIESVQQVCDEVLVVDSISSDKTCEIARQMGAVVVEQAYLGDGPQKAFGEPLAEHDWILSIDADERLDTNAIAAIRALDLDNTEHDSFSFARKTFVGDNYIKLWYPDRVTRLYNRKSASYSKEIGHAKVLCSNTLALQADMLHYSYTDYAHMIRTTEKFITRGAKMAIDSGKRANALSPFTHGLGALIKALIFKGGALHGIHGWNVACVSAFSSYMKYAIMLEMQKTLDK